MARALPPLVQNQPIIETNTGGINLFFQQIWELIRAGFAQSPAVGSLSKTGQTAALATATIYTTTAAGTYRITFYKRKTVADGAASSLTTTLGWMDNGLALTLAFAALTTDTTSAFQTSTMLVYADANTAITAAEAYSSTTPNKMTWQGFYLVELVVR